MYKLFAKVLKFLRINKLSQNEFLNIKGIRYPIDEFLGYSQEKIDDILLRQAQMTPDQHRKFMEFLNQIKQK